MSTDPHAIHKGLTGNVAAEVLEKAHITCNKNSIPYDPMPPKITSGIRLGTPAGTTRGFKEREFIYIGNTICDILDSVSTNSSEKIIEQAAHKMINLCNLFPIY